VGFAGIATTLVPLAKAMWAALKDAAIQRQGARALAALLGVASRAVRPPGEAVSALVAALHHHTADPAVTAPAVAALRQLCWLPDLARRARQEDAEPALCAAMDAAPGCRALCSDACEALLALLVLDGGRGSVRGEDACLPPPPFVQIGHAASLTPY